MKIKKSQIRKLIESYNSMSPASKGLANSIKGKFMRMYPDAKVGIDGRNGFITVNGKKAINMSQASGSPMSDEEMIEKMHAVYAGEHVDADVPTADSRMATFREGTIRTSERQLRKIIREALMTESASDQVKALLDSEYTLESEENDRGIRRDVNKTYTYVRNDGQPIPPEDLKLLQDRDAEVKKQGGGMARLMGVYTSSVSRDGNSLLVKYHRTTAG